MKNQLLLILIVVFRVSHGLGQDVEIGSYKLAVTDSKYLIFSGVGTDTYNIIEIWKEEPWLNYLRDKVKENYKPLVRVKGRCDNQIFNSKFKGNSEVYVFRVVYNYKTPDEREEYIKTLDTRKLNSSDNEHEAYLVKSVSVNGFVLESVSPYVLKLSEPVYSVSSYISIWEKTAWDLFLKTKNKTYRPVYKKQRLNNTKKGLSTVIDVIPGDYVLVITLTNKKTGGTKIYQKIINTENKRPSQTHGDGFSLNFTPNVN